MGRGILKKRKQSLGPKVEGPCEHEGCTKKARGEHVCLTCEKLHEAGKLEEPEIHRKRYCASHREAMLTKVRKHAVTAHPANLLRVIAAGLKGERI